MAPSLPQPPVLLTNCRRLDTVHCELQSGLSDVLLLGGIIRTISPTGTASALAAELAGDCDAVVLDCRGMVLMPGRHRRVPPSSHRTGSAHCSRRTALPLGQLCSYPLPSACRPVRRPRPCHRLLRRPARPAVAAGKPGGGARRSSAGGHAAAGVHHGAGRGRR